MHIYYFCLEFAGFLNLWVDVFSQPLISFSVFLSVFPCCDSSPGLVVFSFFCPFFCMCECSAGPPLLLCLRVPSFPPWLRHPQWGLSPGLIMFISDRLHVHASPADSHPAPHGSPAPCPPWSRTLTASCFLLAQALVSGQASSVTCPGLSPPGDDLHLLRQALGAFLEQVTSLKFKAWVSVTRAER